jgi:divinyl protochlorophyllide a 8-vinyl-reductase
MGATAATQAGRIGPNAILRVTEALQARLGAHPAERLLAAARLEGYLHQPPRDMVPQDDVARLQTALRAGLGAGAAREINREAGRRTGEYLLAHRIPPLAQAALKRLPVSLAARCLARAIGRHAWTFSGSGAFHFEPGLPCVLSIAGCPLCRHIRAQTPACDYFAATFERIFRELVSPRARVTETACQALGAPACRFEVHCPRRR